MTIRTVYVALVFLVASGAASGQQPNSAFASLTLDANDGPTWPMAVDVRTNTTSTFIVSGFSGVGFVILESAAGTVQAGAAVALGGHVDLPIDAPINPVFDAFEFGLATSTSGQYVLNVAIPSTVPLGLHRAYQAAVRDYTSPWVLTLTAATRLTVTQGPTVQAVYVANQTFFTVNTLVQGFTIPFYGVSQNLLSVCENGFVCFAGGDADFTPTPAEHLSGWPRVAGFWTDLDSNSGTVQYTMDGNPGGAQPPYIRFDWINVPDFSGVGYNHNFSIYLDSTGVIRITTPFTNNPSIFETLVGISPGFNANLAPMKNLSAVLSGTGAAGAVYENFYEWFGLTSMVNFTMPASNPYDLIGSTLSFYPFGTGNLPAATNRYFLN